jgi:tetratricopeptide (TPR) repeat protein
MNTRHLLWALPALLCACGQQADPGKQQPAPAADSLAVAIHNMRTDLAVQPNDLNLRVWLANALIEHNEFAAADSQAAIIAQAPGKLPQALYIRGLIALRQQDTVKSIELLTSAIHIRQDSSEYEVVMLTADMIAALGNYENATNYYRLAARIDSSSAEAPFLTGECLEKAGKIPEAWDEFSEAIRRNPAYAPAYIAIGNLLAAQGNAKDALVSYNMAAKADPTNADAFYRRGKTLLQLGNKAAGLDDLTKALSFRKNFPEAQHLLDSAKNL